MCGVSYFIGYVNSHFGNAGWFLLMKGNNTTDRLAKINKVDIWLCPSGTAPELNYKIDILQD